MHQVTTRPFQESRTHYGRQVLVDGKPQHATVWIPKTGPSNYVLHIRRHAHQIAPDRYAFESFIDLCQYIRAEFQREQAHLL